MFNHHRARWQKMTHQHGFTLIELLVVISIIGILAALLLTNFVGVRQRAFDTSRKNNSNQLKSALRLYYNDNQRYPATLPAAGAEFSSGSSIYIKEIPADISYFVDLNGERYVVTTNLENASDTDIEASQNKCQSSITATNASGIGDLTYVVCED